MAKSTKSFVVIDDCGQIHSVHETLAQAKEAAWSDCKIWEVTKQTYVDMEYVYEEQAVTTD